MFPAIIMSITHFITNTINAFGYPGVAMLMAIESAAIPLPSEIIMPFAGFLTRVGNFSLLGLALAGAIGSVVGSWLTYWLGRYGGRPLIERYGKYVFISQHDLNLSDRFFQRYGAWSLLIGRIMPVVRTYVSIPAGIAKTPFGLFTLTCFIGSFIWSLFLAWLGQLLGDNWKILETYFRKFDILIVVVIIAFIVYWIHRHVKQRQRQS